MNYTKGGWRLVPEQPNRGRVCVYDGEGRMSIYALFGNFEKCKPLPVEEAEANARLVAAAPELYEALKRALTVFPCNYADDQAPHTQLEEYRMKTEIEWAMQTKQALARVEASK